MRTHLAPRSKAARLAAGACSLLVLAAPAVTGVAATAAQQATARASSVDTAHLVTTFGPTNGVFVESLAIDSTGSMFVSKTVWGARNAGRVVKLSASEQKSFYGPRMHLGPTGMLLGLAVSARDQLYVARYDFGGERPSVIYRVRPDGAERVAVLPPGAWPNGLAFHKGMLYVSDSALGAIWRFHPGTRVRTLSSPWLRHRTLRPTGPEAIGVNGLAFWRDRIFAVNSSKGTLLRVPISAAGTAGDVTVVTRDGRLRTADGIAFDRDGHLWVVTNGVGAFSETFAPPHDQRLLLVARRGAIWDSTRDASWMNYPTMLALGRTPSTSGRMFVTNGAFYGGSASLVSFLLR